MTSEGCGCPPTGGAGRIHHVFINVTHMDRAREFYDWVMPRLGYSTSWSYETGQGYVSPHGSFWLKTADPRFAADTFHKDRVGLSEIAFAARDRDEVDTLALALADRGATVITAPREYPEYVPGYYAVFFTDPDGLKLELVHIPGYVP